MDATSFSDKWKEVRWRLEVMNKDIITKKQAKFVKDKLAFSESFAYRWTDRSTGRRGPPKGQPSIRFQSDHSESDSSISSSRSLGIGSRTTGSLATNATRKRTRRNKGTSPAAPRKGKKLSTTHQSAHMPGEPSPESNQASGSATPATTLHHLIPNKSLEFIFDQSQESTS